MGGKGDVGMRWFFQIIEFADDGGLFPLGIVWWFFRGTV